MNIAIIGAGLFGSALAQALTKTEHAVTIAAKHPESAARVATDVGASAARTAVEAAREADVIVLAVPYGAVTELAQEIQDSIRGKVVIDATNPLTSDFSAVAVSDPSGAERIAALLPGTSVIKALNTVVAATVASPVVDGAPLDGFYAGDDDAAKAAVARLLTDMGLRPIDAGGLAAAGSLEQLAFLNISLNMRHGWPWASGWRLVGATG